VEHRIIVGATDYEDRSYYVTLSAFTDKEVYLLKTVTGAYIRFHVKDSAGFSVEDVLVTARIGGVIVEQGKTDAVGISRLFLNPKTSYTMEFFKTGYPTPVYTITPTTSDYYIVLAAVTEPVAPTTDVTWKLYPDYTSIKNESITFILNASSPSGAIEYWGMKIENETAVLFDETKTDSFGGSISTTLNFTTYESGDKVYVTIKIKQLGRDELVIERTYYLYEYKPPSEVSLFKFLENIGQKLDTFTRNFFALLMSLFLVAMIAKYVPMGAYGGGIIALIFLGMFTWMGWFDWWIMMLCGMAAIAIYLWIR